MAAGLDKMMRGFIRGGPQDLQVQARELIPTRRSYRRKSLRLAEGCFKPLSAEGSAQVAKLLDRFRALPLRREPLTLTPASLRGI
jgi:hypothetical protein